MRVRALLSFKLEGALGSGADGWELRYHTLEDAVALRPDLSDCFEMPYRACRSLSKYKEAEVFVSGDKRLYVEVKYRNGDLSDPFTEKKWMELEDTFPQRRWRLMQPSFGGEEYRKWEWKDLEPWEGFTLERMENKGGGGAYFLRATLKGDGKLTMMMLTNAPLDKVKAQLAAMDLDVLRAMVTPVPFEGNDTLDIYFAEVMAEREYRSRFAVLSDEEVRTKAAALSSASRMNIISGLLQSARKKDMGLLDFRIEYHPQGEVGIQDTRDYLVGLIAPEDMRFDVLEKEHNRQYLIGSCLKTTFGQYCDEAAERARLAQEVIGGRGVIRAGCHWRRRAVYGRDAHP